MNEASSLVAELRARGVAMELNGEKIRCVCPTGALDQATRDLIARHKADIVRLLQKAQDLENLAGTVVPIKASGRRPALFTLSGHGGDVYWLLELARRLSADQPVYGVQPRGLDGEEPLQSVEALAAYEIEQIRSVQPSGPYYLAGQCAGGTIAFEAAQQLTAAGQQVAFLGLIGSPYPTLFRKHNQLIVRARRQVRHISTGQFVERLRLRSRLGAQRASSHDYNRQHVEQTTMRAVRAYTPRFYAGHVDIFATHDEWHRPDLWRRTSGRSTLHRMDYFEVDEFLLSNHVGLLAAPLGARLQLIQDAASA